MSILGAPLHLLLLMTATTRIAAATAAANGERAIELPEARRICASLCIAGLGGRPCGESCSRIQPEPLPPPSQSNASAVTQATLPMRPGRPRQGACPLLCQYQLGSPRCSCPSVLVDDPVDPFSVDFHRICAYFCNEQNYNVYGCRPCDFYRRAPYLSMSLLNRRVRPTEPADEEDWTEWCRQRCAIADGGTACDCTLNLPLMAFPSFNFNVPAAPAAPVGGAVAQGNETKSN